MAGEARKERKRREVRGRIVLSLKPWYRDCVEGLAEAQGIPVAQMCRHLVVEALDSRGLKAHLIKQEWEAGAEQRRIEQLRRELQELESKQALSAK